MRFPRLVRLVVLVLAASGAAGSAYGQERRAQLPGLHHESLAFDPARGRIVVFAGSDSLQGTWEWDGSGWEMTADSASSPPVRIGAALGYDPASGRMLLFGGWTGNPWSGVPFAMHCDTWAYDGGEWVRVNADACITDRVRDNTIIHDAARNQLLLLDGTPEVPPATVRPLRTWRWASERWELIDSAGPRRSVWDAAAYDAARNVIVLPILNGPDTGVWEWNGDGWRRVVVAHGPSDRQAYAFGYDAQRRQMILVGGQTLTRPATYHGDVWSWDGARWTDITETLGELPVARSGGWLLNDARNERVLYFGGYRAPPLELLRDMWALEITGWRRLVP